MHFRRMKQRGKKTGRSSTWHGGALQPQAFWLAYFCPHSTTFKLLVLLFKIIIQIRKLNRRSVVRDLLFTFTVGNCNQKTSRWILHPYNKYKQGKWISARSSFPQIQQRIGEKDWATYFPGCPCVHEEFSPGWITGWKREEVWLFNVSIIWQFSFQASFKIV